MIKPEISPILIINILSLAFWGTIMYKAGKSILNLVSGNKEKHK
jgi:hypothetical protein